MNLTVLAGILLAVTLATATRAGKIMQASGKADEPEEAMREAARPVEKKMNKGMKQEAVRVEATGKTGGLVEKIMRDADEADEPDEELEPVRFEGGRLGATSTTKLWNQDWSPGRAFQRQSPDVEADSRHVDSRPWLSGKVPAIVYYNFPYPITVAKFSFRNRRERGHSSNNPKDFNFVGSDDCKSWTVIRGVRAVDWGIKQDEEKIWTIDQIDRKKFKCFGIQVLSISGRYSVAIQDLKMWKVYAVQECYTGNGVAYRGYINITESGKLCQNWNTQTPHTHEWTPEKSPNTGLVANYCRLGGWTEGLRPWCYTMEEDTRWEYCNVPECPDCYKGNGVTYRGRKTSTHSGRICQNWASQYPQKHNRTPKKYPNSDLTSNYCRNPDGDPDGGPWCYTTDSKKRYEYCGIPKCSVQECYPKGTRGEDYRGHANVTVTGFDCKPWKERKGNYNSENCCQHADLVENYCRNPSGAERPWCYSTNKKKNWEYCNIPECSSGGSCASNPCKYGTCFDKSNDYSCVCDSSWGGKNCDKVCYPKGTRGEDYRGHENVTVTGSDCKPWISSGSFNPEKNPNSGLEGNYCRNPSYTNENGGMRPWCYSTNKKASTKSKWEYCDIPECADDSSKAFSANVSLQVTAKHGTGYNGNSHYGNVMVAGRPICDNNWDDLDAKVVCRQLGFNEDLTKAIASCCSLFGSVPTNFRVGQVHCQGPEQLLGDCSYEPRSDCGGGEAAGVVCVDPTRLNLRGGTANGADGNVYIGESPVCDNGWEMRDARVVCNSLYANQFSERRGIVPVYQVTRGSEFGPADTDDFIMDQVGCTGGEARLTECSFVTHGNTSSQCERSRVAGVKCARCTPKDLIKFLDSLTVGSNIEESRKSINAAYDALISKCHRWDCSARMPAYPEYCRVKAFLADAKDILTRPDREAAQVSLNFNPGKLLTHDFTKEQSDILLQRIGSLRDQTENFQKQLGGYYKTMANFDRERAKGHHDYAMRIWNGQKKAMGEIQGKLRTDLTKLFGMAFLAQTADMAFAVGQLAFAISSLVSPLDTVVNQGAQVQRMMTVISKVADMMNSMAEMANLGYTFASTLPKLKRLLVKLNENFLKYKEVYKGVSEMVGTNAMDDFTPEKAKRFLEAYAGFRPVISAQDMAEFRVFLGQIVENTCGVLAKPGGVIKAGIRMSATALCPTVKQNVEILKELMGALKGGQKEVMEVFADLARAKFSENAAKNLATALIGRDFTDVISDAIVVKKAQFLHLTQKRNLINLACDQIKYLFYGEEQSFCKVAREDTLRNIGKLTSFEYGINRHCSDGNSETGTFNIPAMMRRDNESVPPGTLDLTSLLDPSKRSGSTMFQIPNVQWLVDNGWIHPDDADKGPFVVQRLALQPLPIRGTKKKVRINSRFFLIKNVLRSQEYSFDEKVYNKYSYDENSQFCRRDDFIRSSYGVGGCKIEKVCKRSDGEFVDPTSPIYPSLLSLWEVTFDIPAMYKESLPFPVGKIDLKVDAKICFRGRRQRQRQQSRQGAAESGKCCGKAGKFADRDGNCRSCPKGSTPRLNGYFCESCPAGFEPQNHKTGSYGCRKCPQDTYKGQPGNEACSPCGTGKHTDGAVGSSICIEK